MGDDQCAVGRDVDVGPHAAGTGVLRCAGREKGVIPADVPGHERAAPVCEHEGGAEMTSLTASA
ncbi:hypothetical protein MOPEL_134_00250 [Mobilicoccus pelagius NBRC 104925]|uniref:Uncharacterized protein n=1 Tax=Mobilicoccus pelagius NBRC 104925 TaxID=1089455 RepID=H5UVI3_9MICO|nr:hypothetical protein MOPEL_134_00250 [Mobilicoccus pelagius NBRC 104925]